MPVGSGEGFYIPFLSRLEEINHVGAGEERAERFEWEWKLDFFLVFRKLMNMMFC